MSDNIFWHRPSVVRADRERRNGHRGAVVWFTGLPGSGKSTLAHAVEAQLHGADCQTYVLDGDNVRHGLCADLGFSAADRSENARRIAEMARLFVDAGIIVMTAFISPYGRDRAMVRERVGARDFFEIYCRCPVEVCQARDRKGVYRRALAGEIREFTGVSAPYEAPASPELALDTATAPVAGCVAQIVELLRTRAVLGRTE